MRKNIIIAAVVATFSMPVMADTPLENCKIVSDLANTIMERRQAGADMAGLLEIAKDSDLATFLIMEAYKQPQFNTEEIKLRTIRNFKNDVMRKCMED